MAEFDPEKWGEMTMNVQYLIKCCDLMGKKMEKIDEEQNNAKNRTIGTLVGVIVTLAFIILTYVRLGSK